MTLGLKVPATDAVEYSFVASVEYLPGTVLATRSMDDSGAGVTPKNRRSAPTLEYKRTERGQETSLVQSFMMYLSLLDHPIEEGPSSRNVQ